MSWTLKLVSPVHIGTGTNAPQSEFLIEDGRAYYVPPECLSAALWEVVGPPDKWKLDAEAREKLAQGQVRSLRDLVDIIAPGRWQQIRNHILQKSGHLYCIPAADNKPREVAMHIKQEPDRVYIPGSSIKGAIRTAMLFAFFQANPGAFEKAVLQPLMKHYERYKEQEERRRRAGDKKGASRTKPRLSDVINKAFSGTGEDSFEVWALHGGKNRNPQASVMRHLLVADTDPLPAEEVLALARVEIVGMKNPRALWQEVVRPETEFPWRGIDLEPLMKHASAVSWQAVAAHQRYTTIQTRLVSRWDIVADCLFVFAHAILKAEVEYWEEAPDSQLISPTSREAIRAYQADVMDQLHHLQRLNSREHPLVRIGADEGFLSTTISLLVREQAPDVYQRVIVPATRGKAYPEFFPKTRRLVHLPGTGPPMLAGWAQIVRQE